MTPETRNKSLPGVFVAAVDIAIALGVKDICKLDGCWEHQIDEHWWMAVNGHRTPTECSVGATVPPFSVYFQFNGWPAGFCDAGGGTIAAGELANEASLLTALGTAKAQVLA